MKVSYPSKNPTSLEQLILQLQLTLELSQFQELLSIYTDFLLLFAEYPSLFKFFKNEPNSLQGKNALFKNRFITQDPARDGENWWNYCNGNPVNSIDLDGKIAGYFTNDEGAGGFGHSGMFVNGEDGKFYVFEVIGVGDKSNNKIPINKEKGTTVKDAAGLDTTILSNISDNSFPSPELSNKMGKSGQAACLMRVFDNQKDMEDGLVKLGFDNCIFFDTTSEEDSIILNSALSKGEKFTNYHLLLNSCGGWARDVLCTDGSGINPFNPNANINYIGSSAIPKTIGANLLLGNSNSTYKELNKK